MKIITQNIETLMGLQNIFKYHYALLEVTQNSIVTEFVALI